MRSRQHRELVHLAETRDLLVKQRTALKNKINNLLAMHGIDLKREALSSNVGLERALAAPLTGMPTVELRVLVEQVRTLNVAIEDLGAELEEESRQQNGYAN